MVKVFVALSTPPLSVPPLSCAMTVTVAVPIAFKAGVKVSVPPLSAGCALKSEVLSLLTPRFVMLWLDSLAGPVVMVAKVPKLAAPLSCSTTTFEAKVMTGASFTGTKLMVKVLVARSTPPLAVPPSSCTMTVTVAEPLAFADGVKVRVPPVSAGATLKSEGLSLVTERPLMVWLDSLAGPVVTVAKPTLAAALSSSTTTLFVAKAMAGVSFTGVTVTVKVWGALVSTPPLAVPPSSCAMTVTVAEP